MARALHAVLPIAVFLVGLSSASALAGPRSESDGKAHPALMALYARHASQASRTSAAVFASDSAWMRLHGDRVLIDAVADGDPAILAATLTVLGAQHLAIHGRVISGQLPIAAIPSLNGIAHLRFARPAYASRLRKGR